MSKTSNTAVAEQTKALEAAQTAQKTEEVADNRKNPNTTRAEIMTKHNNNKSACIRELTSWGWTRSQVAKLLDIKYQFVRNVLTQQPKKSAAPANTEQKAA